MKDLLKVLALMALLLIAVFQSCENTRLAASPGQAKNGMQVHDDVYITTPDQPVELNVLANDHVNLENSTVVFSSPVYGSIMHNPEGGFRYLPKKGFKGKDTFEYRVCLADACKSARVTLSVN